jgi:GMP reductase
VPGPLSTLSSRSQVDLTSTFTIRNKTLTAVPVMSANMDATGTILMAEELVKNGMLATLHKHYPVDRLVQFFTTSPARHKTFYSMGMSESDIEKFKEVKSACDAANSPIELICLDVANGYMGSFRQHVQTIRDLAPDSIIMAGNVVTPEGVSLLANSGADIIKIGIGNGSCCLTRTVAGVGIPQLTAVIECAKTETLLVLRSAPTAESSTWVTLAKHLLQVLTLS